MRHAFLNPIGANVFHPLQALLGGQGAVAGPVPPAKPFPHQRQRLPVAQQARAGPAPRAHQVQRVEQRAGVAPVNPAQRREMALRAAEERAREEKRARRRGE